MTVGGEAGVTVEAGGSYTVLEGEQLTLECRIRSSDTDIFQDGALLGWRKTKTRSNWFSHIMNNASEKVATSLQSGTLRQVIYREQFLATAADTGTYFCFYKRLPEQVKSEVTQLTVIGKSQLGFNVLIIFTKSYY